MSRPNEPGGPGTDALQFDRAEPSDEGLGGPSCRECNASIRDEYYDVAGNVVCPSCLVRRGRFRARWIRGLKALLLGSVAAAVGAGIYRMILFSTGWNFSLVAILVGYMVGGAVRSGSDDRGGRIYQLLAVFLTYSALVGMFLPSFWKALASRSRNEKVAEKRVDKKEAREAKIDPNRKPGANPTDPPARSDSGPRPGAAAAGAGAEGKPRPSAPDANGRPDPPGGRPGRRSPWELVYLLGMLLITTLMLIGLVYSIPVLVGFHSPISLLIFACALWQAWIMTRASELPVTGPYRIRRSGTA